jgi:hypothetical protein
VPCAGTPVSLRGHLVPAVRWLLAYACVITWADISGMRACRVPCADMAWHMEMCNLPLPLLLLLPAPIPNQTLPTPPTPQHTHRPNTPNNGAEDEPLFMLDLLSMRWHRLSPSPSSPTLPPVLHAAPLKAGGVQPRFRHTAVARYNAQPPPGVLSAAEVKGNKIE